MDETVTIKTSSFTLTAKDNYECMELMLDCLCLTLEEFAEYMGVSIEDLSDAPKWAINYLKDTIDIHLLRIGYIMEDSKQKGILGEYRESSSRVLENGKQRTITINEDYILNKENTLKISIITMIALINKKA